MSTDRATFRNFSLPKSKIKQTKIGKRERETKTRLYRLKLKITINSN